MIFRYHSTAPEDILSHPHLRWHRWFAWYPVSFNENGERVTVFLERVWRRGTALRGWNCDHVLFNFSPEGEPSIFSFCVSPNSRMEWVFQYRTSRTSRSPVLNNNGGQGDLPRM